MNLSLQTWSEYFKSVIFAKDDLEKRDMSKIIALLPILANQNPKSDEQHKFHGIKKPILCFKYKVIDGHFEQNMKLVELKSMFSSIEACQNLQYFLASLFH